VSDADRPPPAVVLGPCDDMRAEVFLRAPRPDTAPGARLAGTLGGPTCRHATTLPATARLVDLPAAGGSELVARAVLTEPAFWTPELPNLYRLDWQLLVGSSVRDAGTHTVGLRRSGVRGRSLWLEGRRWVPRGVRWSALPADLAATRAAGIAGLVADPAADDTVRADVEGVALVALAADAGGRPLAADAACRRIHSWATRASVVLAVLPVGLPADAVADVAATVRRTKGTMLLAATADGATEPSPFVPPGIDLLVVELAAGATPHAGWRAAPKLPLVAWRHDEPEAGRRACDRLQADLAAWGGEIGAGHPVGDWAGYLVG